MIEEDAPERDRDRSTVGPGATPGRLGAMSRRQALALGAGAGAAAGGAVVALTAGPGDLGAAGSGPGTRALGIVAVEDFRTGGMDDDTALAAAVHYAAAQTYKPAIVFANRSYDVTRPVRAYSGLHLTQLGHGEEFRLGQSIRVPAGGLVAFDDDAHSITLEELSCLLQDHLLEPIAQDASQGAWRDVRVLGGGTSGGTTLLQGAFLRLDFQPSYVNDVSDSVLRIGGSDSWLFTRGPHYVSGTLPADRPFLDLGNLGQSVVGSAFITAEGGYGVAISGRATGLRLIGTMVDATRRTGRTATQLAGVQLTGGIDTTVTDLWVFNANVSGQSPGLVTVTGGEDILFIGPRFPGAVDGQPAADVDGPCIHTTVPITVIAPKAPGRAKLITEAEAGLVTLVAAPGWDVRRT